MKSPENNSPISQETERLSLSAQTRTQLKEKTRLYYLKSELSRYILNNFCDRPVTTADIKNLIKETQFSLGDSLTVALVLVGQLNDQRDLVNEEEVYRWYRWIDQQISKKF